MATSLSAMGHHVVVLSLINPLWRRPSTVELRGNLRVITSHFLDGIVLREMLLAGIVQFEYPYLLPMMIFLKMLGRHVVLDEHGIESVFLIELKKIPKMTKEPRSIGFLMKRIPWIEYGAFAIEKLAIRIADAVFVCSNDDALEIRRLYEVDKRKVVVVPNAVDSRFFDRVEPYEFGRPTVLFLGSFDHPPNLEGALTLTREIMPCVWSEVENALCVFIGKNPPNWKTARDDALLFIGRVEDVRPLIAGANVVVAPIFSGSGTRQKIVEYMALGKPIVSTTKGAQGLELTDGTHFMRRDTIKSFSEAVVELMRNREQAGLLGNRVRKVAEEEYSWDSQINIVVQAYRRTMRRDSLRRQ